MATSGKGDDVQQTSHTNVWLDDKQPSDFHLTIRDEDVVHPGQVGEVLHLLLTANPRSAKFNPKSINTFWELRATLDKPHPASEANESIPRQLDRQRAHLT